MPCAARFSAVCTPVGERLAVQAPRRPCGPRKPISAPGSATVTCASEPQEAKTPPVVGCRRYDEVGQAGCPVVHQRARDLDHLHERRGALLHAGAAGGGGGQQRDALGGGPADRGDDPVRGGAADRAREEAELVDHDGHRTAADQATPGEHRLVDAGLLLGRAQLGQVGLRHPGAVHRDVPGIERARVEHQVEQLGGGPAPGHSSSSQARIDWPCWSSVGGAAVVAAGGLLAVATGEEPQRRPGQRAGRPRVGCSTSIEQALAQRLVPRVDLVEAAHLAGRDPGGGQLGQQRLGVAVGERRLDQLDDPVPVADPLRGSWPGPRPRGRARTPAQNLRHRPSLPTAICTDAVAAAEEAVRRDATGGGCPARGRPRPRPSTGCPGRRARRRPRRAATCARRVPTTGAVAARGARRARRTRRTSRTSRSAIGMPTRCGSSGPDPVSDISPASPWAIWS